MAMSTSSGITAPTTYSGESAGVRPSDGSWAVKDNPVGRRRHLSPSVISRLAPSPRMLAFHSPGEPLGRRVDPRSALALLFSSPHSSRSHGRSSGADDAKNPQCRRDGASPSAAGSFSFGEPAASLVAPPVT